MIRSRGALERAGTWSQALAFVGVFLAATWLVARYLVFPFFASIALGLAISAAAVASAAVIAMVATITIFKIVDQIRSRQIRRYQGELLEKLANYAIDTAEPGELQKLHAASPRVFERCLLMLLPNVSGAEHERLSDVTEQFGLLGRWEKGIRSRNERTRLAAISRLALVGKGLAEEPLRRALNDRNAGIRTEAARALLGCPNPRTIGDVLRFAVGDVLLVRALLVQDLRRHAPLLSREAIPDLLRDENADIVVATLDVIDAWKLALAVDASHLLRHSDSRVRARAFETLPYLLSQDTSMPQIVAALSDADSVVRIGAIEACIVFRASAWLAASQEEVIAGLDRCLREAEPAVAVAAARALAQFGELGMERLDSEVRDGTRPSIATEAMERKMLGPQLGTVQ